MGRPRSSQTASGEATYLLHTQLRVPKKVDGTPAFYLNEGTTASTSDLEGLRVDALEQGGFVEKLSEPKVPCELCQAHGSEADKKKRYGSREELAAHYAKDHPAFEPAEEV